MTCRNSEKVQPWSKLKETLPKEKCTYSGVIDEKALEADLVFVGFGTYKGECDEELATFLSKFNNKKVYLFGTAGFGKSSLYFEQIIERVKKYINESGKMLPRRVTGACAKHQRFISIQVKRARFIGLIPYKK